ncbi:Transcriptional regulator BlaI [Halomicronema hongdechloris C2206]|uniref:Transcriptional regulator BlaI n=1 Tax=Halomicronema hongdechloris C2206 TaxID=1641165 RepID=A0A1Z3HHU5_9CYAN|nr:BlaI/MecI/CopY family transcriptional regulator [Halomicronema hongdechloris]ASC69850.1 Transcriptional regulator BlaI [Halomicronema hongdechloris C2206]
MAPLPQKRPRQLSLGPLEQEIMAIIWQANLTTATAIHGYILRDPDRELAYASVMTVLQRLGKKGWVTCDRSQRPYRWYPVVSSQEAAVWKAHQQLADFLAVGNPDVVAAFADSLDTASVEQLDAIARRIQAIRQQRQAP